MMAPLTTWLALLAVAIGAGAMVWLAIHRLTGGVWGDALAPSLAPFRWALLPAAVLAVLAAVFAHDIAASVAVAFAAWAVACLLDRRAPAVTLIGWLVACTALASGVGHAMSPPSHSLVQGMAFAVDTLGISLALAVCLRPPSTADTRSDAGALLVAWLLGWAYLAGVDYLTAWVADQPAEVTWYLARLGMPWRAVLAVACVSHATALALLVGRRGRSSARVLRVAAIAVLLGEACHLAWRVWP